MITAPWTDEQVANLNEYQRYGYGHPFTCRNRTGHPHEPEYGDHGVLRATPAGWVCAYCDYTQNWAHEFMADPQPDPDSLPPWERVSYWQKRFLRKVPGTEQKYMEARDDWFATRKSFKG